MQQIGQLGLLLSSQILRALEQQPARLGQHRIVALRLQLLDLLGAHLVNRLAEMRHDVEAVEDMHGPARPAHLRIHSGLAESETT